MKTITEKRFFEWVESDVSVTIRANSGSFGGGSETLIIYDELERNTNGKHLDREERGWGQQMPDKENFNCMITNGRVRRLTPRECERLQGFPDDWTNIGDWVDFNGKKHKAADTPRYKALGNALCLPFWKWLARRICAQYERPMTMASLFDGIGGFPLVFQEAGAIPVWASEIDEFCIAVTKERFGEE